MSEDQSPHGVVVTGANVGAILGGVEVYGDCPRQRYGDWENGGNAQVDDLLEPALVRAVEI